MKEQPSLCAFTAAARPGGRAGGSARSPLLLFPVEGLLGQGRWASGRLTAQEAPNKSLRPFNGVGEGKARSGQGWSTESEWRKMDQR